MRGLLFVATTVVGVTALLTGTAGAQRTVATAPVAAPATTVPTTTAPPKVKTTYLPPAEVGDAYRETIAFTCADGPCRKVLRGKLPPGMNFHPRTATIAGTPTKTGKYPVRFTVTDKAHRSASRSYTVAAFTGPILVSAVPEGEVGVAYTAPLKVRGGRAPYAVSITGGALPAGLSLDRSSARSTVGVITGTPTTAAASSFTLTVKAAHGLSNSFPETVTIVSAPSFPAGALPGARTGLAYAADLAVTGGQAPYTWSVTSGALPVGLHLDGSTGAITGTPDLAGARTFSVKVTDALGGTVTEELTLTVALWKPPLVPKGSLLGASVYPDHSMPKLGEIVTFEKQIGRTLDIDNNYFGFKDPLIGKAAEADEAAGRIPLVSWACGDPDGVLAGTYDAQLKAQADAVKAFGYPVYLRYSWEMDQGANHLCANKDGTAAFRAAWRHIWTIFKDAGATNAAWVWCPSHLAFSDGTASEYYPGNRYVDYVCADGYSRSATSPTSFATIFGALYKDWSKRKPILIGETGQVPGAKQAAWITQTGDQIRNRFPDIKALLYFDSHGRINYAITPKSLAAFAALAQSHYFNPLAKPIS
jgi:hypothetical protein